MLWKNPKCFICIYPMSSLRARLIEKFTDRGITFSRNGKQYLEIRANNPDCTEEQKRRLLDRAYSLLDNSPDSIIKVKYTKE